MNILHLVHGLWGRNNGVDTYLSNFVRIIPHKSFIAVPCGLNASTLKNVIEIESLFELKKLVIDLDIDFLIVHWTGSKSFKLSDNFVKFNRTGKILSKSNKPLSLDFCPDSFIQICNLFHPNNRKVKLIIRSHTTYKLPTFACFPNYDAILHVSYASFGGSKINNIPHFVVYPALEENNINYEIKAPDKNKLVFGWLGRLNKIESKIYKFIEKVYGNRKEIEFVFAGDGGKIPDKLPDNFTFPGIMNPKEFFDKIDVFFYPTSIDSFSLSLLEALSQSKICIASEIVSELGGIGRALIYRNENELKYFIDSILENRNLLKLGLISKGLVLNSFSENRYKNNYESIFKYLSESVKVS